MPSTALVLVLTPTRFPAHFPSARLPVVGVYIHVVIAEIMLQVKVKFQTANIDISQNDVKESLEKRGTARERRFRIEKERKTVTRTTEGKWIEIRRSLLLHLSDVYLSFSAFGSKGRLLFKCLQLLCCISFELFEWHSSISPKLNEVISLKNTRLSSPSVPRLWHWLFILGDFNFYNSILKDRQVPSRSTYTLHCRLLHASPGSNLLYP